MLIPLRYDRTHLPLELPDGDDVEVLRLNPLPPLDDADAAIAASFRAPLGCEPLEKLARGRESACIVVCDITRPVPNEKILTPLLGVLHDCGLTEKQITILVATGLHRANCGGELDELLGEKVARRYRVKNHDARDVAAHGSLGEIQFGDGQSARVAIDSDYLRADLKITTGLIEPHFMAGYSGGRKLVCPGLASAETILQFHAPAMIAHPAARAGNLEGNPIHQLSRAVAGKAGMDFMCNVTLSEDRQITGVFSGALDEAHAAGVAHVDRQTKVPCREADIVVTSGAGYPLDTTLYQSVKGMRCALSAVREGGTIIVAAGMKQGVGGAEFAALCATLSTPEEFIARIFASDEVVIDQWQLQPLMQVLQKCEVMVVTDGLPPETLRRCLLTPMGSLGEAVAAAKRKHGDGARWTVIPEGPYVTPVPAGASS